MPSRFGGIPVEQPAQTSKFGGVPVDAPAPLPGTEAFGGEAPGVPKPPLPLPMRADRFGGAQVMGAPIVPSPMAAIGLVGGLTSKLDDMTGMGHPAIHGVPVAGGPILPRPGTEAAVAKRIGEVIPSTERAAGNFESVMQGTKDIPIDTTDAGNIVLRAREMADRGASMPKVANNFLKRASEPGKGPITYEEGRDFASNSGRLSVREAMKANPAMGRQVSMLAKALDTANEGAAESAGLGNEYRAAMKEYRQAAQMKTAGKVIGKAALAAAGAGGTYELAKKALGVKP